MKIKKIINELKNEIENPEKGLGEELFLFISSLTPMVNVDLLIKNDKGEILLTWREKMFHYKAGWHIPGGVLRYKETLAERVRKVAKIELNAEIVFNPNPIAINEVIIKELKERAHFISFLYECRLVSTLDDHLKYNGITPKPGCWKWFSKCPENLIEVQKIYKKFFK